MKVLRNLMLCVTLFSALALPTVTYAQFVTGHDLKIGADAADRIRAGTATVGQETDYGHAREFLGYIQGYHDTIGNLIHCFPSRVNVSQLAAVVTNYLRDHPEQWSDPGSDIIRAAMYQAFPCPESSP